MDERIKIGDIVQHCRRPDFELIIHPFAPSECEECARIEEIQNETVVESPKIMLIGDADDHAQAAAYLRHLERTRRSERCAKIIMQHNRP